MRSRTSPPITSKWQKVLRSAGFPTIVLVLDFETYWDVVYSLRKMSTIEYVTDKQFAFTGLAVRSLGGRVTGVLTDKAKFVRPEQIDGFISVLKRAYGDNLSGITVAAHNANFDCLVLKKHFGIMPKFILDGLDLAKMWDARGRHDLRSISKEWGLPVEKGDTKMSLGLHWDQMPASVKDKWIEYSKTDVDILSALLIKMLPEVVSRPGIELPVASMTHSMFIHPTFRIDVPLGESIRDGMRVEMMKPISRLSRSGVMIVDEKTGEQRRVTTDDVSRNKPFVELVNKFLPDSEQVPMKQGKSGMIPALAKDDAGMKQLLSNASTKVRLLAEARSSVKSWPLHIKKVENILRQAKCQDGRIGTPLGYHNAHTGRWGGAEKINLQNLGGPGRGGAPTPQLIQDVRKMLMAPKGFVLGINDYSKVEAVGVAWQAGQHDLLEDFRTGGDPYSDLATDLFQEPVHKPLKTDPDDLAELLTIRRSFGKDAILGCGYGMGWNKFYARCLANEKLKPSFDDGTFDENFVKRVIDTYRSKYSKIPKYWTKLEKSWRWATKYPNETVTLPECSLEFFNRDGATFIRLPSGRTLRYPKARVLRPGGELRFAWGDLYGGKLTENVSSGLCRDFIAESLLKLRENGFWCLLTVHDEIVAALPENKAEEKLKEMGQIMTDVPTWAKGFPLAVEGQLSERYCK
ncbi:MAG TPA: DNA polymerase [Patescibacteria group bacterium]|nr:DNA polymerase [Patescibacteria group bacterium]